MRKYSIALGFLALTLCSLTAYAEILTGDAIPEKITQHLYKKHPKAIDVIAEKANHFSQEFYEVRYKEDGVTGLNLYRSNGGFHVAGIKIAADDMMFTASKEKLKTVFPEYSIKDAILIVNPSGVGEEYEVIVESGGKKWDVSIDKAGNVDKRELN